ncbi:MAG: GatB/YqeY domain-containing protein [Flavobacteriales bacterium]|mgnify:CR=1 FL=1|nr:GatB/YqeY domain-containing protein [Flavobacteriales bacterium]MCB0788175.1 GatB/YqeY domain-containing protein [Flavobacteriales bacterium]MCB0809187.1 GatB/YqeY domain-containing protein [Flavobacteriales bacterium]MCB0817307.1 GatB/YqeY domain-containing protein [Flavobacteriales bacterium]MCB9180980.1 GatB/YqeY domain-containing protein [Flavobacteriales bacterium]
MAAGLTERIDADIREAMRARDRQRLDALRAIKSALMLELTKEGGAGGVDEATGTAILRKLHKQRGESAQIYRDQGREDLALEEEGQAAVIADYLPEALTTEALGAIVQEVILELGAGSMADMGRVVGAVKERAAGRADGAAIAAEVKRRLSA